MLGPEYVIRRLEAVVTAGRRQLVVRVKVAMKDGVSDCGGPSCRAPVSVLRSLSAPSLDSIVAWPARVDGWCGPATELALGTSIGSTLSEESP
jgi:hypothetical protein